MDETARNAIKYSVITNIIEDTKPYPSAQIAYHQLASVGMPVWPYGFGGVAPVGSLNVTLNILAEEENQVCFPTTPHLRPKNLKEGETYFGNLLTGTLQINRADGNLEITVANDQKVIIKRDLSVEVKGKSTVVIDGASSVSIKGKSTVVIEGDSEIDVKGKADLKVSGDLTLNVSGKVSINSNSIDLGQGGAGIARLGDSVLVDGKTGTITSASTQTRAA